MTDDDGANDTDTAAVAVTPSNQPPVADAGSNQTAEVGVTLTFNGSGSTDPDGTISSYEWDFGDGNTSIGMSTTHAYSTAGTYLVTLTVTDDDGANDTDTAEVIVTDVAAIPTMHISSINMATKTAGINTNAIATVKIVDADNNPVGGATVSGNWTNLTSDTDVGITDASGIVILQSDRVKRASGTFTFTVDDVSLSGWSYDLSANVETNGNITA